MSQLDQAINDFVVKQNLILGQYQQKNNDFRQDVQTLVRELLLAQKGMSVIDQGDIWTKCPFGTTLTDFTSILWNFTGAIQPETLNVKILDLKGARRVRLYSGFDVGGENNSGPNTPCGLFGFFSDISNDTPRAADFSFLGAGRFADFGFVNAAGYSVDLNTPANLGTLAGTIDGTIFPSGGGEAFNDVTFTQECNIECATANFLYIIYPCAPSSIDLFNASQNQTFDWYATYQLIG